MKIIKRISDNLVVYAEENLELTENGCYGNGWFCKNHTTENSVLEDVDSLPEDFIGGGWTYNNEIWSQTDFASVYISEKNSVRVPQSVTMRQARLALSDAGILTDVINYMNASDIETQIYWETSRYINRLHPIVENVRVELSMSQTDIDFLFILADSKESDYK